MEQEEAAMKNTLRGRGRSPGRPSVWGPSGATVCSVSAQSAFARYGYEQASVRKIAASAGFDAAPVAHHFGSKEALWDAVPHGTALVALQSRNDLSPRERLEKASVSVRESSIPPSGLRKQRQRTAGMLSTLALLRSSGRLHRGIRRTRVLG
jgi:hypothetical protein